MKVFAWVILILVAALLYAPLLQMFALAFSLDPENTTAQAFWASVTEAKFTDALRNSFAMTLPAALLTLLLSFGPLYWARKYEPRWLMPILAMLVIPFFASPTVTGLAFAKAAFSWLGTRSSLTLAIPALAAATLPIAAAIAMVQLQTYDHAQERLAASLGATPLQVVERVTIPLLGGGLIGAALIGFLLAFNNTEIAMYVAGSKSSVPTLIWGKLRNGFDADIFHLSALLTATFLVLSTVAGFALWLGRRSAARPRD